MLGLTCTSLKLSFVLIIWDSPIHFVMGSSLEWNGMFLPYFTYYYFLSLSISIYYFVTALCVYVFIEHTIIIFNHSVYAGFRYSSLCDGIFMYLFIYFFFSMCVSSSKDVLTSMELVIECKFTLEYYIWILS